ncbi:MAG: hypothetical protein M1816_005806 [Peltula sp. TS41687]|nr:MAG: hypothetical protein M1816_005806 [Peltula sp. TS41687]
MRLKQTSSWSVQNPRVYIPHKCRLHRLALEYRVTNAWNACFQHKSVFHTTFLAPVPVDSASLQDRVEEALKRLFGSKAVFMNTSQETAVMEVAKSRNDVVIVLRIKELQDGSPKMMVICLGPKEWEGDEEVPHIAVGSTMAMWPQGSWLAERAGAKREAQFTDQGHHTIDEMVNRYDAPPRNETGGKPDRIFQKLSSTGARKA